MRLTTLQGQQGLEIQRFSRRMGVCQRHVRTFATHRVRQVVEPTQAAFAAWNGACSVYATMTAADGRLCGLNIFYTNAVCGGTSTGTYVHSM
jgi:hypothetical protein